MRERAAWWHRASAGAALALLRTGGALPHKQALRAGAALGRAWVRADARRTRYARANLRIAFPDWNEAARESVLLAAAENLGRAAAEFARFGRRGLSSYVRMEGEENLHRAFTAARAQPGGGGVIALTAHFGNWELMAYAMAARGLPLTIVQRARENPVLELAVAKQRARGRAQFHARGNAARASLRALREGRILAMLYDQNCGAHEAVFVPFFGRKAAVRAAPAKLALHTGAPVVPAFMQREAGGAHHVCRVLPHFTFAPGTAVADAARRMSAVVEAQILRAPEQWIWMHRRFRTQAPGEPPVYR